MFGSAARGDGGTQIDLDLLVVRDEAVDVDDARWRHQLGALADDAHSWTGNRLSWLELAADELAAAAEVEEPIVAEWRRNARHLAGTPILDLVGAHR